MNAKPSTAGSSELSESDRSERSVGRGLNRKTRLVPRLRLAGWRWNLMLGIAFWGLCLASQASACPTCKDALAANGSRVAEGFYWSILFMLAMPASIAAGWAIYLFRFLGRASEASLSASSGLSSQELGESLLGKGV